ncbi:MAG: hypothetical protein MRK01_06300 [Candidatus Scalindua sp.]|nr:hypothetical protein [Candidatus Scalindua sp.]
MNTDILISQENPSNQKTDEREALRALNHRLCNIRGIIESCTNLLKYSDDKSMIKRWSTMRNVFMVTGRDRINSEMEIYCTKKETIEGISLEIYRNVYDKLALADSNYKSLFDLVHNSITCSDDNKNESVIAGEKITDILGHIIQKLEVIKVELQKTENPDR